MVGDIHNSNQTQQVDGAQYKFIISTIRKRRKQKNMSSSPIEVVYPRSSLHKIPLRTYDHMSNKESWLLLFLILIPV